MSILLDALHVDSARAFVRLLGFKGHGITFAQFVEGHTDEGCGMEENILSAGFSIRSNKAETLVRQSCDFSGHSVVYSELSCKEGLCRNSTSFYVEANFLVLKV